MRLFYRQVHPNAWETATAVNGHGTESALRAAHDPRSDHVIGRNKRHSAVPRRTNLANLVVVPRAMLKRKTGVITQEGVSIRTGEKRGRP